MNSDLDIMIALQELWIKVMDARNSAERSRKSITLWENRNREIAERARKAETDYKNITLKVKQEELDLAGIESKIEKTEARRNLLKTERELEALDSELQKLKQDRDSLETSVFTDMERSDELQTAMDDARRELSGSNEQTTRDIEDLKKKIELFNSEALTNEEKFRELKNSLSPAVKSRFEKLINSKDGIAISRLKGEICSHCNFQVPSSVASAVNRDSLSTCTNCGRFLY